MAKTNIEWTECSWNPMTGCDKVSPGCKLCYMMKQAPRLKKQRNPRYQNVSDFTLHPDKYDDPLSWRKPRLTFVNSMSDLFHDQAPEEVIRHLFRVMNEADRHIYQILTKRAGRLAELGPSLPWSDHIWAGVSVENDEPIGSDGYAPTDRIDDLRRSGASVKWISAEPLIGPLPNLDLEGIDWIVIGGESGPKDTCRPMKLRWVRSVIRQCRRQDVPVFVKQLGSVWAREHGLRGKAKNPAMWPRDLRIREFPDHADRDRIKKLIGNE